MKRIIAAAILTVLALSICWFGRMTTNRYTRDIITTMNEIDKQLEAENIENALEISKNFFKKWEPMHDELCLFLQHEHLDPLESAFAVLPYYIEQGQIAQARTECQIVRTVTNHILQTEQITPENIL